MMPRSLIDAEIDKWPKVSREVHDALVNIVSAVSVIEKVHSVTETSCEDFIEALMNFFPTGSDEEFRVNPSPIVNIKGESTESGMVQ